MKRVLLPLLLLALAAPAFAADASRPPQAGSLLFGTSLGASERVLGKHVEIDVKDPFIWYTYPMGKGQLRTGFYKDRLSVFKLAPEQPLTWSQARAWASAFVLSFERGRQIRTDPRQWLSFSNVVLMGRPFEVQLTFEREDERVTSMGGEIHWLD